MLTNREAAILIWLAIAALVFGQKRTVRSSFYNLLATACSPIIVATLLLFACYFASAVFALWLAGVWSPLSTKATVLWGALSGIVICARSAIDANSTAEFSWSFLMDNLKIGAFVAFLAGLPDFSLIAELLFVPVMFMLGAASAVGHSRAQDIRAAQLIDGFLGVVGLLLLVLGAWQAVRSSEVASLFVDLSLPIVLAAAIAPFAYFMALVSAYELFFTRVGFGAEKSWPTSVFAMWQVFKKCGFRISLLKRFDDDQFYALRRASTRDEVLEAVST